MVNGNIMSIIKWIGSGGMDVNPLAGNLDMIFVNELDELNMAQ